MREPGGWNQADVGAALTALRNIDLSLEGIHGPVNAILQAVVDPKSMPQRVGNLTSDRNILTDVRPGARLRLFLVGGGELLGDYEGYTDELDHSFAWVALREGKATVRVGHIAGVVEISQ